MFSYCDVTHEQVMHMASLRRAGRRLSCSRRDRDDAEARGAGRRGHRRADRGREEPDDALALRASEGLGQRVVAIRHPMPYGELAAPGRASASRPTPTSTASKCTIEEREEYEPHLDDGVVVYAGVDYGRILASAQKEADVIVWDGGNNDFPFYKPDAPDLRGRPAPAGPRDARTTPARRISGSPTSW